MAKRCKLSSMPGDRHDCGRVMKQYQSMKEEIQAMALKQEWELLMQDMVSTGFVRREGALRVLFALRDRIVAALSPATLNRVFGPLDDASIREAVIG